MELGNVRKPLSAAVARLLLRHASRRPMCSDSQGEKQDRKKIYRKKKDVGQKIPVPDLRGEILWGIHPVLAALRAQKRDVYTAYFKTDVDNSRVNEIKKICKNHKIQTLNVTGPVLDSLASNHPHQGICLDVSPLQVDYLTVDELSSDILQNKDGKPSVWVLPYRVKDTMNMGAILRSSQYFGVDRVLMPAHYSAALNSVVSKASAGALEIMDIKYLKNDSMLHSCLMRWKDVGGRVVGSTSDSQHTKAAPLHWFVADRPTLLIIGNEAEGIGEKVSDCCDVLLSIQNYQEPALRHDGFCVDSLNVSVATGVLLHSIMMSRNTLT